MNSKEKVFVLGCERSGSTWLSNIFDANPNLLAYLEPFGEFAGFFSRIPPRYCHVDAQDKDISSRFLEVVDNLYYHKYCYLYKPGGRKFFSKLDHYMMRYDRSVIRVKNFRQLNMNAIPVRIKNPTGSIKIELIKELRLNLKVGLLQSSFPQATYFVTIRNPVHQVASMQKWIEKNALTELRRQLVYFLTSLLDQKRFSKYWDVLDRSREESLEFKLLVYWIINYDFLIEDLIRYNLKFEIIKKEELSEQGLSHYPLLTELMSEESYDYFNYSTTYSGAPTKAHDPLHTLRNRGNPVTESSNSILQLVTSLKRELHSVSLDLYNF